MLSGASGGIAIFIIIILVILGLVLFWAIIRSAVLSALGQHEENVRVAAAKREAQVAAGALLP